MRARVVSDVREAEVLVINPQQLPNEIRWNHPEHPFLRLSDGDHLWRHPFDRNVDSVKIDLGAVSAVRRNLRRASNDAARAEIFKGRAHLALAQERKDAVTRSHQNVFEERIGDLHGAFVELRVARIQRDR